MGARVSVCPAVQVANDACIGAAAADLEILGVVYGDPVEAVRELGAAEGASGRCSLAPTVASPVAIGVLGIPESFLISPPGLVVSSILRGVRAENLEQLVQHPKARRR